MDVLTAERPTWRGLFHTWAFWLAIPAGVLLIVLADRPAARTAAAIYAATLLLVFGTSSAYHRLAKTYRARQHHAAPRPLDDLSPDRRHLRPDLPGGAAAAGGAFGAVGRRRLGPARRDPEDAAPSRRVQWLSYALYLIMGWVAVIAAPVLIDHLTPLQLA